MAFIFWWPRCLQDMKSIYIWIKVQVSSRYFNYCWIKNRNSNFGLLYSEDPEVHSWIWRRLSDLGLSEDIQVTGTRRSSSLSKGILDQKSHDSESDIIFWISAWTSQCQFLFTNREFLRRIGLMVVSSWLVLSTNKSQILEESHQNKPEVLMWSY